MRTRENRAPRLRIVESVQLDVTNQCLWRGGRRILLRPKDFAVLHYLHERAGQLVSKTTLLDRLWPEVVVTEAVLKACINRLRQALSDDAKTPRYIETMHRVGYRLLQPLPTTQPVASSQRKVASSQEEERQKSKGETDPRLLTPDPQGEAEVCFLKAIEIAQKQQAKSFELRATISLVRLRQQQATDHATRTTPYASRAALEEGHHMLSEIYHWFTKGFNTTDLQEAKVLLQELRRSLGPVSKKAGTSLSQVTESRGQDFGLALDFLRRP